MAASVPPAVAPTVTKAVPIASNAATGRLCASSYASLVDVLPCPNVLASSPIVPRLGPCVLPRNIGRFAFAAARAAVVIHEQPMVRTPVDVRAPPPVDGRLNRDLVKLTLGPPHTDGRSHPCTPSSSTPARQQGPRQPTARQRVLLHRPLGTVEARVSRRRASVSSFANETPCVPLQMDLRLGDLSLVTAPGRRVAPRPWSETGPAPGWCFAIGAGGGRTLDPSAPRSRSL